MDRKDDEWITVGGMITAAKKIRARAGSLLMFATLDDLEGAVELMVFEKTLAAAEAALQLDEIVLVKGRVDHKEGGKLMRARAERRALRPLRRRDREGPRAGRQGGRAAQAAVPDARRRRLPASVLEDLKRIIEDFPGESELVARGQTSIGPRAGAPRRGLPRARATRR